VRQVRETLRRQSQAKFLQARRRLVEQLSRLTILEEKQQQAGVAYAGSARGRTTAVHVATARHYLSATELHVAEQGKNVATAEGKVEEARQDLMEKAKDKKILDRLRERQLAEYRVNAQREKQKQIDETARQKYFRVHNTKE
jgi:flagellar FliJ protein